MVGFDHTAIAVTEHFRLDSGAVAADDACLQRHPTKLVNSNLFKHSPLPSN